ncbi:3'-5' exoribonuclease 1 [Podochytrium sp. JEL0797]|nr:3'-5' exoribonuclease 1 [Podochytrium sp. JEL0797]
MSDTASLDSTSVRNPTVATLRAKLSSLGLPSNGHLAQLKKRLRNHAKRDPAENQEIDHVSEPEEDLSLETLTLNDETKPRRKRQPFDYYCVFDVEATCVEDNRGKGWKHEIIEFPVVLIEARTLSVVAEFRSFVQPTMNPILTDFCTSLTGITQSQVSTAPLFPEVLRSFERFLTSNQIKHSRMMFITDGPWDIRDFVRNQCLYLNMKPPAYFGTWIDLRRKFTEFYGRKEGKRANLSGMLSLLGMQFEGREHSGIDDTRNIAKIALRLMEEGVVFDSTKPY